MLTRRQCLSCFVEDISQAVEGLCEDPALRTRVLALCLRHLAENLDFDCPPSYHITHLHRLLKKELGLEVPFADRRHHLNQVGMEIAQEVKREARGLAGYLRFRHLALWALAANSLDSRSAGTGYAFPAERARDHLRSYLVQGVARDELELLFNRVQEGKRILYVHDNVGEVALDAVLIEEMRRYSGQVVSVLRGGAITSDATWEDGLAVSLPQVSNRVIIAGPDTLGISFREMSPELAAELEVAELVIAKGQANFYVLSQYRNRIGGEVFCLFSSKCDPVAALFGLQGKQLLAFFLAERIF